MNQYLLPVIVRAFPIRAIEGYSTFPIETKEKPEPTPGGLRMVYSMDDEDTPVCVDSAFINSIIPHRQGMYVEYPDGHSAYMEMSQFLTIKSSVKIDAEMSFSTALTLMRLGYKLYRRSWKDIVFVSCRTGEDKKEYLAKGFSDLPWTPSQDDYFGMDWVIVEIKD